MKMRNRNGFVFMETVVVVCVLSITLMLLYGSYAYILRTSREKQTFDTTDSIYTTYNVIKYSKLEYLENIESLATDGYCTRLFPSQTLPIDPSGKKVPIGTYVCDVEAHKNLSGFDELYSIFDVDKIYINLSPREILNSPNKNDLLMMFDASTIDYIQSLGVGEDVDYLNELYFIVKYKHVYDDGKYDVVHSTLREPIKTYNDHYDSGNYYY